MRVAAGEKGTQPQLDRVVEDLVADDRGVLAARTDNGLAHTDAANLKLPDRENAALESRHELKTARMNDARIAAATQLGSVDHLVELGDDDDALRPSA